MPKAAPLNLTPAAMACRDNSASCARGFLGGLSMQIVVKEHPSGKILSASLPADTAVPRPGEILVLPDDAGDETRFIVNHTKHLPKQIEVVVTRDPKL